MPQYVIPIENLDRMVVRQAGSKSVHLGELAGAGFRVPRGFCILSSGYGRFVEKNSMREKIRQLTQKVSGRENTIHRKAESGIVEMFRSAQFPDPLKDEILSAYRKLSRNKQESAPVAVRSSGSMEDSATASFAGQFESFLNVRGEKELLEQIKCCWAGFWKVRSLYYQMDRCGTDAGSGIAVLVQKMVSARVAGVLFSANPLSATEVIYVDSPQLCRLGQCSPFIYFHGFTKWKKCDLESRHIFSPSP